MGRSAGAGSPVWFICGQCRSSGSPCKSRDNYSVVCRHKYVLTGQKRPYKTQRNSATGVRSSRESRQYQCECGHTGWSNHIDLERLEGYLDA